MQQTLGPRRTRTRTRGLDGIRALAVIAVVVYHVWPAALPGGFIGVDVFFVLSGFLITRSFRSRSAESVTDRLARFWQHRARRILPPLLPVIVISAITAALIGGNLMPGLWAAVLGAVTFSSNWVAVAQAASYFTADAAHPLQHLWSLAVEEQFYLVWPLVLLLLGRLHPLRQRWIVAGIAGVSAIAMAAFYQPGVDPTAVYVGTGTHMFGLALGAALALHNEARPATQSTLRSRVAAVITGFVAVTALIVGAVVMRDDAAATYRGGLVGAALAATALIWSLTQAAPGIGRLLDVAPLAALGRRSYAVYLWHWPILVLATAATAGQEREDHTIVGASTLVLTAVASAASWRWLEQPVLLDGWRACFQRCARRPLPLRVVTVVVSGTLVFGTGAACVASARPSDAEQLITAGQHYLEHHSATPVPTTPTPEPPTPHTSAPSSSPSTTPAPVTAPPDPTPSPTVPDSTQRPITAVGDSVMLAAAPTLQAALPDIAIDAEVSRQPSAVAAILRADAAAGRLADTVLVGIGTNGALGDALPAIRAAIGPHRTLILITVHADRSWAAGVNENIRAYAETDASTRVADWNAAITGNESLLAADGIHPGPAAARIYAAVIVDALRHPR